MDRKNWFTVAVSKINKSEGKAPYEPFEGHTLTISNDGTLWISGEKDRVLSVAPAGYAGFEFKRLEGAGSGDQN